MSEETQNASEPYVESNADVRTKVLSGIYSLNHKYGRSRIWKFFGKVINDKGEEINKVCCILCYTVLSSKSKTTSNLVRHRCYIPKNAAGTIMPYDTVSFAKGRILSKVKRIKNKSVTALNFQENSKIRDKILSNIYHLRKAIAKSQLWKIYEKIEDSEGNEIPNKVCCKICYDVLNQNEKNTSNLLNHRCYMRECYQKPADSNPADSNEGKEEAMLTQELESDEGSNSSKEFIEEVPSISNDTYDDIKAKAINILSQWCIEDLRPFELVKDTGLRRFTEFIISVTANYGMVGVDNILPDALTISQSIESHFNVATEQLGNEIELDCKYGFGLTSKLWIDNCWQQKYIILTIHYIKNGQLISKFLGLNVINNEESINDVIGTKIIEILTNYNFSYKDSIIVLDGNYNITSTLENCNHFNCISQILNNAVDKAIQEVKELNKLYCQCLKVKKYSTDFSTNCNLSAVFKSFSLFDAIEKNWHEIENILLENKESQKIKNIQKKYLEAVLRILRPFEHACKILEGEKYPTLHLVYAYINGIKDSCLADNGDNNDNVIRQFKKILIEQLQTTVISKLTITHKIALFLFPPANKLTQFSEDDKNCIKNKIISYLEPYVRTEIKKEMTQKPSTSAVPPETMISSYFKNFVTPPKSSSNCDEISNEIRAYESINIPYDDNFNILQWWHSRQAQFPLLYILSCKILAAPASCATSERILSIARYLEKNNVDIKSNPKIFNQLIFLNFNRNNNSENQEYIVEEKPKIGNETIEDI